MKRLLPCTLIAACFLGCQRKEEEPPKPLVDVKVAQAEQSDVNIVVRAPANVFAREQSNVAPRLTAPVREMPVRKGDTVAASQIIARLENRDLLAQRMEAAASLADAESSLAKVTTSTLPADIDRARGQVATTQAALNQAQKFYDRRKQLFDQGAIPARDLTMSETELAQARTNYEVAAKALQLLEGQSRERDIQIARSRVEQARGRLGFVDAQLSYTDVRSPFAGTVTEQFLFPGDMAKPDSPIFTIADLSIAVARAQVPEANAADVHRGAACAFFPSDQADTSLAGKVTVVNQAVDATRRTVEVWCEIPNPKLQLRAGTFGTVNITTGILKQAVVVPISAVQFDEGTTKGSVWVAGADHKAVKRAVETSPAADGKVAITQGLRAGEIVIIEGGYGLPDGTAVQWQGAAKE